MACRRVQELALSGPEVALANALLAAVDQQYERALEGADQAIATDSSQPYAHALRSYCLRQLGRDYDASLAEAKAARMGGNTDFRLLFPPVRTASLTQYAQPARADQGQPALQQPTPLRRRMIRFRFATRSLSLATLIVIAINVIVFVLSFVSFDFFIQTIGFGPFILQGQVWRLVTATFFNYVWLDLLINMLWLYIMGRWVEQLYGFRRFWLIYLGSGIFGGLLTMLVAHQPAFVGAATAVLGVFGALGAYLWHRGAGAGLTLGSWLFWVVLNLALTFAFSTSLLPAEIGGLAAGLLLGLVLLPDYWKPLRFYLKQGQRSRAFNFALRPILWTLAIDAGLLLFTALVIRGAAG
jgi:membrane associated rhomboid family serine protease